MIPVPTLADIVADRGQLLGLPFGPLWELSLEVGRLQTAVTVAMLAAQATTGVTTVTEDRLLTHEEAGARCGMSAATMKRWAHRLPYSTAVVVLSRTRVRWSAQQLDDVLRTLGAGRSRRKVAV